MTCRPTGLLRAVCVLVLAALSAGAAAAAPASSPATSTSGQLPPAIAASPIVAGARSGHSRLDADLAALAGAARHAPRSLAGLAEARGLRLSGGRVLAQLAVADAGVVARAVVVAGGEVTTIGDQGRRIQAWLPPGALERLAQHPQVLHVRRPAELVALDTPLSGRLVTEGLAALNGQAWHAAGITGAGVRIAVVDGSFAGYEALLGTELPASVTTRSFVDGADGLDGGSPHGTACAEVVHDIAPGAELYLVRVSTDLDLEEAVNYLVAEDVDLITTSIGWMNLTPGDGSGFFGRLVAQAHDAGILWFTAAGNMRLYHYGAQFRDESGPQGAPDTYHEFADGVGVNCLGDAQGCFLISEPADLFVTLRWDDWAVAGQNVTDEDYDLSVVRYNVAEQRWEAVATSARFQDGRPGQTPTEELFYRIPGDGAAYGYVVTRYSSSRPVQLELFALSSPLATYRESARSLLELANVPAAVTVGAVDAAAPHGQESYSSEGPTSGPGGAALGGVVKPDLAGYANVTTVAYEPSLPFRFSGTSAATPHAAGAAALLLSAQPGLTPDELRAQLEERAEDLGPPGKDNQYGAGRVFLGEPPLPTTVTPITGLAVRDPQVGPVPVGAPVTLEASVSAGSQVTYAWAFGDGATGSGPVVTHAYAAPGSYIATVSASNDVSNLTTTVEVVVEAPEWRVFLPLLAAP